MQISLFEAVKGHELRDDGIQRAVAHANETIFRWSDKAYSAFQEFLKGILPDQQFQAEDFRSWLTGKIEDPPSKRAFGGIIIRAAKNKLIKKVGHKAVNNPKAHRAFASLWIVDTSCYKCNDDGYIMEKGVSCLCECMI